MDQEFEFFLYFDRKQGQKYQKLGETVWPEPIWTIWPYIKFEENPDSRALTTVWAYDRIDIQTL